MLVAQPLRLLRRDSSRRFLPSSTQDSTRVSSRQAESLRHGSTSAGISGSDLDVVEAGGARAVTGADHLLRLAFAAVGHAPEDPMIAIGDGGAGIPELGGDPAVGWILEHPHAPAVANLPGDLAAELKVVALVVDGPAPVGLHIDCLARSLEELVERLLARKLALVGLPDEREARPSGGSHGSVRALLPDSRARLSRSPIIA